MIDLGSIGSDQGVIIIAAFLLFKDVFIPLWKKVIIPKWAKLVGKQSNPNNTLRKLNPNGLTLERLHEAVKQHEKMDEKRCDELKVDMKEISQKQTDYEARLRVLESHRQSPA